MAEDNLERSRLASTAFNEGDLDAWAQHYDADVVFEDRNPTPGVPPVIHGLAELRKLVQAWVEAMPDFRVELREMEAVGDCVVGEVTYRGTGAGSGLAIDLPVVDVSWWHHGRVVYYLSGLQSLEEGRRAVSEDQRVTAR